jgi:hypothetical protein
MMWQVLAVCGAQQQDDDSELHQTAMIVIDKWDRECCIKTG